jgi:hypothetical protein
MHITIPNTLTYIFVIITFAGCGKVASTNEVESFCNNLQIGSDHERMEQSLSRLGLELRTRAPDADLSIKSLLQDPYSVDGVMVTSKGLEQKKVVPACQVYFSSVFYSGNGKIVHKKFITATPKGI